MTQRPQVSQLPEDDVVSMTRQEMLARLVVAMGGRAAEERIFGACIPPSPSVAWTHAAVQVPRT